MTPGKTQIDSFQFVVVPDFETMVQAVLQEERAAMSEEEEGSQP